MKTIDQLLDCIEDDMELMGENHIIYLMEVGDEVVDYDYLPSSGYTEAVTLKTLRDELELKKRRKECLEGIRIGMIQMKVLFSEPERNLKRAAELIREAKEAGGQICVLPECMDLGWGNTDAGQLAEGVPGKVSDALSQMARENGVYLVAGVTEKEEDRLYNTALLISDEGTILHKHRKINVLKGVEDLYSVGDRLGVIETKYGKIGMDICADNSEDSICIGMTLGKMGAEMLLSPCAWAVAPDRDVEKDPYGREWRKPYKRLAVTYGIPVVGVSNVGSIEKGSWKGWKAIGNSMAYDSDGTLITELAYGEEQECVKVIEVHP